MSSTKLSTGADVQQNTIQCTRESSHSSRRSVSRASKYKVAIASVLILTVVTVATVCAAIFIPKSGMNSSPDLETEDSFDSNSMANLVKKEAVLKEFVAERRSQRASIQRRPKGRTNPDQSCYSLMTNDSYPAAHVTGNLNKWSKINSQGAPDQTGQRYPSDASDYGSYQTHWICSQPHDAFVDGGMYFNQTDKKLYVPSCGYYYLSSQMSFTFTTKRNETFVAHRLNIDRNCPGERNLMTLESRSSLGAPNVTGSTSTYVADIVKMCAGGKISVTIPADNTNVSPCCPYGLQTITFLSAHLVSQSDCKWPIPKKRILAKPPTQEDYDSYYNSLTN